MLTKKSLIELRGIAQSFNVPDIFQKDKAQLLQAIELRQKELTPAVVIDIPKPAYDARLMSKIPTKKTNQAEIEELLAPYVTTGLKLSFDEERWYMSFGKKTDEGSIRMPLRTVLYCARKMML